MPWAWDTAARRYIDTTTHQFMSRDMVLSFVNESIAASDAAVGPLAEYAAAGALSPADFTLLVRTELKQETIRQYLLGIGGRDRMTQADWGRLGSMLREQYGHLDKFAAEIAGGNLSEEQIRARLSMYTNSSREAYERAHQVNAKALGMDEEAWMLGQAEHCDDCIAFNAQGWQPIGTFPIPGAGATQCLTNCQCEVDYRNSKTGDWY